MDTNKKKYIVKAFTSCQELEDWMNSEEMSEYVMIDMADTNSYITVVMLHYEEFRKVYLL